jgi:FAD:protein FMN transferase
VTTARAAADWTAWSCRVRVVVTDPAALDEARAVLRDDLAAADLACSRFRPDSELAAVEAAAGSWVDANTMSPDGQVVTAGGRPPEEVAAGA